MLNATMRRPVPILDFASCATVRPIVRPTVGMSVDPAVRSTVRLPDRPSERPTVRHSALATVRPIVRLTFRPTVRSTGHPTVRRDYLPSIRPIVHASLNKSVLQRRTLKMGLGMNFVEIQIENQPWLFLPCIETQLELQELYKIYNFTLKRAY